MPHAVFPKSSSGQIHSKPRRSVTTDCIHMWHDGKNEGCMAGARVWQVWRSRVLIHTPSSIQMELQKLRMEQRAGALAHT